MRDVLVIYFNGEKNAGLLLVAIGLLGATAAAIFLQPRWRLRSFAITLAVLAVIELAIGVGLYARTGLQARRLINQLESRPAQFVADETSRMTRVQRNFVVIEYAEVAVLLASAFFALAQKSRPSPTGIALGLVINAAVLLAFDLTAERRGAVYLAALQEQSR
jgi:hypothetical protein